MSDVLNDLALAWALAKKFHAGQKYGDYPYTFHLAQVESRVRGDKAGALAVYQSSGAKLDFSAWHQYIQVVAILHDFLEDTDGDARLLAQLFPDWVVEAIVDLSKWSDMTDEEYMQGVKKNPVARFVKFHDAKANMQQSLDQGNKKRAAKYMRKMADLLEE
jgi:(p)ppGpp synthase/HD superfamily hydrolase